MPNIVMTKLKNQPKDKIVRLKVYDFLEKLAADDSTHGLRIKKMNNAVDPRARTARIDQGWRAVLYLLEDKQRERTWVFAGAWEHDVAIERARTIKVNLNSVNGAVELIAMTMPKEPARGPEAAHQMVVETAPKPRFLDQFNYSQIDLTDELGFDSESARALLGAQSEDEVLSLAEAFENAWEQNAAVGLAAGETIEKIRDDLGLATPTLEAESTEDENILRALASEASRMQFTFADDNEDLRRIIEGGDFAAWRVFLHPEQTRYVERDFNGAFRLSGGAGTGKTVVLLHRTRRLAKENPHASIVLTTYTRALAENLKRDLALLDPELPLADSLGSPGILIRGVDQLAAAVRARAGATFGQAAAAVFGTQVASISTVTGNSDGWASALASAKPELPEGLLNEAFFEGEYLQIVLPTRASSGEDFYGTRRPGRGVALDRKKRVGVWATIQEYRMQARAASSLSFAEVAEVAAAWLDIQGEASHALADHVLVDEGQDLVPSQWKMLRALARPGKNDMFIAEDAHQRIYGHHVVLARCGISIVGRSRRLTLNYRTTAQNLAFAVRVLEDGAFVDAEGADADVAGYHSARQGPVPMIQGFDGTAAQLAGVCDAVEAWLSDESVDPGTVAVLARSNDLALAARDALIARGIAANNVKSAQKGSDRVLTLTMHTAKGMEFSRAVLFDVSQGVVPSDWVVNKATPEERADVFLRERSLLYVAASRARDALYVTWAGAPSPLLAVGEPASGGGIE